MDFSVLEPRFTQKHFLFPACASQKFEKKCRVLKKFEKFTHGQKNMKCHSTTW